MEHYQNGNYNMSMKEYEMKEFDMKKMQYEQPMPNGPEEMPYEQPMPDGQEPMPYDQPMPHGPHMPYCGCQPIQHQGNCNVIHRYHVQEVPHICNYHTHIVNHNIQKHRYIPRYTCSEETKCHVENCGSC